MSRQSIDRRVPEFPWGQVQPGSPSEVIAAMRGSSVVTLRGYAKQEPTPASLQPWVCVGSSPDSAEPLQASVGSRSRLSRATRWCTLALSHLLAGSLGALMIFATTQPAPPELIWRVLRVQEDAVLLQIGDAERARTLSVPVGAALPDGQILTFVDAAQSMYATGTSRVFLGQEVRP